MKKLEQMCNQVINLTRTTGKLIQEKRKEVNNNTIESKGKHDFVTQIDKLAEKTLVRELQLILPESGFITEEKTTSQEQKDYNWIVDPIDGTTNYIHGIPAYSISIALMHKGEIILGVVYEINLDECFYATKGGKAYMNDKEIHVSTEKRHHHALLATGFPYTVYDNIDNYLALFKEFMLSTSGIRRIGSAAVDLVYVACGRFEGFYEHNLHIWDIAAGCFIVQQAGGKVTDFKGTNNYLETCDVIASNGVLHNWMTEKIIKQMGK